jgi:hypothetical protein
MSLTVIAHFCKGTAEPFPSNITNIAGEGSACPHPDGGGGFIIVSYDTNDIQFLVSSFKAHLKENELTMLCVHKVGDKEICFSETSNMLF